MEELKESDNLRNLWLEYQNKNPYSKEIDYIDTINSIKIIIQILEEELVTI